MEETESSVLGLRAAVVRWASGLFDCRVERSARLARFSRFWKEDEEMDRLVVFTMKRSRFLVVMPDRPAMSMQIRDAKVRRKGIATQINRPAPILAVVRWRSQINRCDGISMVDGKSN